MLRKKASRIFKIACVVSLAFGAWPPSVAHAAQTRADLPPIFISEIAWAGSSRSTADEWLELANASDGPISVSGWRLEGAGGGKAICFPAGASVPARGAYLIANYNAGDSHSTLANQPDVVTTTISLTNDIQLIRLLDATGALVDQAGDGGKPYAGYSSDVKASMVRVDAMAFGDAMSVWTTATSTKNLVTADFGTPGLPDIAFPSDSPTGQDNDVDQEQTVATSTIDAVTETEPTALTDDGATESSTSTDFASETIEQTSVTSTASDEPSLTDASTTTPVNTADIVADTTETPMNQGLEANQIYVRLNEVMPDPAEGPEWVEIVSATPDRTIPLDGLELHDAVGKIMKITGQLSPNQTVLVIELSSARFNNTGDSVYLKKTNGTVIDTLTYADSQEGLSWARDAQGAWRETETPTKGTTNSITESTQLSTTSATSKSSYEPTAAPAKKTAATKTVKKTSTTTIQTKTTSTAATEKTNSKQRTAKSTTATKPSPKTTTKTTTTTTTKKSATLKKSAPIIQSTLDMLDENDIGGLRVALEGTVGTPSRLVSGHTFVLLNQQGRGLLVRVPTAQKLPSFGSAIRVTGSLKFDTRDLPYLSMAKDDGWSLIRKILPSPQPKSDVLLEAPSAEDVWALVATSGTVISVSGKTIMLATDGADVSVRIRPGVAYRAARLKTGDTIRVTGLLDTSGDVPAILPRMSDEIELVAHAPIKNETVGQTTPAQQSTLPGWMPFGAAALAVGAIQGMKTVGGRLKKRRVAVKTQTT